MPGPRTRSAGGEQRVEVEESGRRSLALPQRWDLAQKRAAEGASKCVEEIRRYADQGLKGTKMFPNLGFYLDAPEYYPIYEAMIEHGLFAMFHMGFVALSDVD